MYHISCSWLQQLGEMVGWPSGIQSFSSSFFFCLFILHWDIAEELRPSLPISCSSYHVLLISCTHLSPILSPPWLSTNSSVLCLGNQTISILKRCPHLSESVLSWPVIKVPSPQWMCCRAILPLSMPSQASPTLQTDTPIWAAVSCQLVTQGESQPSACTRGTCQCVYTRITHVITSLHGQGKQD